MAWRTPPKPKDEDKKPELKPLSRIPYDDYEEGALDDKRLARI
jgi:hypothetical protein